MGRHIGLLFGISISWLALSILFDVINMLALPLVRLGVRVNQQRKQP